MLTLEGFPEASGPCPAFCLARCHGQALGGRLSHEVSLSRTVIHRCEENVAKCDCTCSTPLGGRRREAKNLRGKERDIEKDREEGRDRHRPTEGGRE